jgi:hypothetical protein
MFLAVKILKQQNLETVNSILAVKNSFLKFENKCHELENMIRLQIKSTKGYTALKKNISDSLCETAVLVSSALFAYSSATKNNLIKEISNFSPSRLKKMRDNTFIQTCKNLYALASENQTALASYNIDDTFLLDFKKKLNDADKINPIPIVERSHRKVYTHQLTVLFKQVSLILSEEVDKTMVLLKKSNPDFYQLYKNARTIINFKTKKKTNSFDVVDNNAAIFGFVFNKEDFLPVINALVQIPNLNMEAITDEDGEYYIENIPAGKHTIIVFADAFNKKTLPDITITKNDLLSLNIYISPSGFNREYKNHYIKRHQLN